MHGIRWIFSEYAIKTDKPIYVAVTYAKDKTDFNQCLGVYYDTKASEKRGRALVYLRRRIHGSLDHFSVGRLCRKGKAGCIRPARKMNPETDAPKWQRQRRAAADHR